MNSENYDELIRKLPDIAKAVNAFSSEVVQQRAYDTLIQALLEGAVKRPGQQTPATGDGAGNGRARRRRAHKTKPDATDHKDPAVTKGRRRSSTGLSVVGDLNLRPKEKQSFVDFAKSKNPTTASDQNVLAVYYVKQVLGISPVTANHVYTCYKGAGWRLPANPLNSLAKTGLKGWLETGNRDDIKLTTHGENLVEHDLPRKTD